MGVIPAKEVTFRNLNDNTTKIILTDMCKRFGEIEDCKIYYDRQTKKHLGLGTVKYLIETNSIGVDWIGLFF